MYSKNRIRKRPCVFFFTLRVYDHLVLPEALNGNSRLKQCLRNVLDSKSMQCQDKDTDMQCQQ